MHAVGAAGAALLGRSTGPPLGDASLRPVRRPQGGVQPRVWFWLRGLGPSTSCATSYWGAGSALTLSKAIPGAWAVGALSQDRGIHSSEQRSLTRQHQQEATGLIQSPETWG